MAESPGAHWSTERKLYLKWVDLIEARNFTGDHLKWHQAETERQLRAAASWGWEKEEFLSAHPVVVDHVGILRTVELAKERFSQRQIEVLPRWACLPDVRLEQYAMFLRRLRELVILEVANLWKGEWHSAWFDRVCKKKVDDALDELQRTEVSRVRRIEITHLERPYLSLPDLIAADGDISLAETIQRANAALKRPGHSSQSTAHNESPATIASAGQESLAPAPEPPTPAPNGPAVADGGATPTPVAPIEGPGGVLAPPPINAPVEETQEQRAHRRQSVVNPILKDKRWTRGRLAKEAGVGKNSVYEYLDGARASITDVNRKAIADSLGLNPNKLEN